MTRKIQGFDVGGSSVKAGLVDVDGGQLIGELISAPTPRPATPAGVMQVIAGLSRRLPEAMKSRHPSIAWRDMAGAGNVYRHDYDDVAARYVWHTLTHDLQPLRLVVLEEIRNLGESR